MLPIHTELIENISKQIEKGARTFLFLGDRGIGKKTVAQTICGYFKMQPILCENFLVERAREIKQMCTRRSDFIRAFIIDGDASNANAFNAILKTLEEPPEATYFFVCCSSLPLATVVSRCLNIFFPRLTEAELLQVLKFKGMNEKIALSVITYSSGSVTEAYKIYERLQAKKALIPHIKALQLADYDHVLSEGRKMRETDLFLMRELVQDLLMARYGLRFVELTQLISASTEFLTKVGEALDSGSVPSLCYLRAWMKTR